MAPLAPDGRRSVTTANLKRKGDSPPPSFPHFLKSRIPVRKRPARGTFVHLTPPVGLNLATTGEYAAPEGGSAPEAAFDGDSKTAWKAGQRLNVEFQHPTEIKRVIIRHPDDRLYAFRIAYLEDSTQQTRVHARLYRNLGQVSTNGTNPGFRTARGMIYVNGSPLEEYVANKDTGTSSTDVMS